MTAMPRPRAEAEATAARFIASAETHEAHAALIDAGKPCGCSGPVPRALSVHRSYAVNARNGAEAILASATDD